MKRYACHRFYVSSESYLDKAVVEIDNNGFYVRSFPLLEETEHTLWLGGVIVLAPISRQSVDDWRGMYIDDLLHSLNSSAARLSAWHIDTIDWETMKIGTTALIHQLK